MVLQSPNSNISYFCLTETRLLNLAKYIRKNWIDSTRFPPATWSVNKKKFRTNNHLEGGHRHLNTKTDTGNMPIYPLIHLLHDESNAVELQCNLLKENQLDTYITAKYAMKNRELFELWAQFDEGKITVKQLLHSCARVKT